MLKVRKSGERGYFDHGWLKTHHTFSFGDYIDRHQMAFRNLRVINEDFVAGGHGFGMHPHRDMEILTYIVSGALEHKDSMGNCGVIRPGEVQYMSAGTGVLHSEANPLPDEACHLLQIWILPRKSGLAPAYDQRPIGGGSMASPMVLVAAPDDDPDCGNAIAIRADTRLYAGKIPSSTVHELKLRHGYGWFQLVKGEVEVVGGDGDGGAIAMGPGDGLAISDEVSVRIKVLGSSGQESAEALFFDLS